MRALLDQIKQLNEILKKSAIEIISFDELTKELSEILSANTYVSNLEGKMLSYKTSSAYTCEINDAALREKEFPTEFNEELLSYKDTESNMYTQAPNCIYGEKGECIFKDRYLTVIPIIGTGKRLGSFVLAKYGSKFTEDEIIVCEYAAAIVAMELIKLEEEKYKDRLTKITAVKMAYAALSFSEQEAIVLIIKGIDNREGLVIASTIANEAKITRSVISNALRKLESAGIIQTRSLGMKGTYIKIINDYLLSEIEK